MGRTLIILVILIAVIIAAIVIAVQSKSTEVPELLDEFLHSNLAAYALNYGIKQVANEYVTGDSTQILNLEVPAVGGRIDTLTYTYIEGIEVDTVSILASISWVEDGERKKPAYASETRIVVSTTTPYQFGNYALTTIGPIDFKGHSSADPYRENYTFTFEDIFGMTLLEAKNYAIAEGNYYEGSTITDPGHGIYTVDSFTWMEGNYHPTSWNISSGILIVNGDLKSSAHVNFTGVIYVIGEFFPTAHTNITGAVFVETTSQTETDLSSFATITYDQDVIDSLGGPEALTINIIYWRE
ncbi:MAG: hypothetical protein HQ534_02445 [Armatimonadetes bacterium]|nr:hypothetical protein [Armatimonadota bacterium]